MKNKRPTRLSAAIMWGAVLETQRLGRKLTITELSNLTAKTGKPINYSNIRRIERGEWDFRISTLTRILSALNLSIRVVRKRKARKS